jgi:hypothetical protein
MSDFEKLVVIKHKETACLISDDLKNVFQPGRLLKCTRTMFIGHRQYKKDSFVTVLTDISLGSVDDSDEAINYYVDVYCEQHGKVTFHFYEDSNLERNPYSCFRIIRTEENDA